MAATSPFLKAAVQHPVPPERINLEPYEQYRSNGSDTAELGLHLPISPAPAVLLSTGDRKPSVPSALPPVVVPHGRSRMPSVIKEAMRIASSRRTVSVEPNVVKDFGCGDKYQGSWQAGLPQGHGTYTWADSSMYKGDWEHGVKYGSGMYRWKTGDVYRGEWQDGCMCGHGVLTAADGSEYTGGWQNDLKHGLGRKVHASGDVYEGLWKNGKPEGPGRYCWINGNEYDGEWRGGLMHGQGTLIWASGDRFDGKWEEGLQNGVGVFAFADGSSYNGFWRNGVKDGVGLFKPPLSDPERQRDRGNVERSSSMPAADRTVDTPRKAAPAWDGGYTSDDATQGSPSRKEHDTLRDLTSSSRREECRTATVRQYVEGNLVREEAVPRDQLESILGKEHPHIRRRDRRARAKGPKRPGERIYKGHKSYDLMLNLQLGIRFSVGGVEARQETPTLKAKDFQLTRVQQFPREGSQVTPPHPSTSFKWKDYCPVAFAKLRKTFHIDPADYMLSICGDKALRELPSPGKSGSVFFISHDERFFIKTMRKGEMTLLLKLLPQYAAHIAQYPDTLLIKYLGMHRVKPASGGNVRFVVMNNLLRTDVPVHRKFDLKGSTHKRTAGPDPKSDAILKDLDIDMKLYLAPEWHHRFTEQLVADCQLLEALRVMDYSLLLGIHSRTGGFLVASTPPATDKEGGDPDDDSGEDFDDDGGSPPRSSRWPSIMTRRQSGAVRQGSLVGLGGFHSRQDSIDAAGVSGAATLPNVLSEADMYSSGGEGGQFSSGNSRPGSGRDTMMRTPGADSRRLQQTQQAFLRRFGDQVSEQRVEDLVTLARYKIMGRAEKVARPPASFSTEMPSKLQSAVSVPETAALATSQHSPSEQRAHLQAAEAAVTAHSAVHPGGRHQPLGVRNSAVAQGNDGSGPEDAILYFGIIDILQEYNVSKRVEHRFKSLVHDSRTISAVSPVTYSKRFQEFLHGIFKSAQGNKSSAVLEPMDSPCPEAAPSATLKLPLH